MYGQKPRFPVMKTFLFTLIVLSGIRSFAAPTCASLLQREAAPKEINYFMNQILEGDSRALEPKFIDPAQERDLAEQWRGTRDIPQSVKSLLHGTAAVLDYQVLAADKGAVVKAAAGKFTSFRFNHEWRGKDMSTNVGLPIDALFLKGIEGKNPNMLVPENAEAVFVFMHGGGTKTTGHQVAANITNYLAQFGVVVLAIDAPFHAYGPRINDLTPQEYYEYLRDFRQTYIPEGVPTFIGGHSMGGLHADNIMRMSDDKELGMDKAFKGLINLSGPMDSAPGGSPEEKAAASELISSNEELMLLVPEEERDLTVSLLLQGKSSALSGVSAETFMSGVNWVKPEHNGDDYIPTLVVMGERDALYVGQEEIFQEYLADLTNTETHLLGQRKHLKGHDIWISHMIFDHKRPDSGVKENTGETFLLVREFMETQLGKKFGNESEFVIALNGKQGEKGAAAATKQSVAQFIQAYIGNLAFRKFIEQYTVVDREASPRVREINEEAQARLAALGPLRGRLKALDKLKKSNKATDEELAEQAELSAAIDKEQAAVSALRSRVNLAYVPDSGENVVFAEENIAARAELKKEINSNGGLKKKLLAELRKLEDQVVSLQARSEGMITEALERESHTSRELALAQTAVSKALDEMLDLQVEMNERNSEMVRENFAKGIFEVNPPADLIEIYKALDNAYAKYNEEVAAARAVIERLIDEGEFGPEFQKVYVKLHGSKSLSGRNSGMIDRMHELRESLIEVDVANSRLTSQNTELVGAYVERVVPELYKMVETTGQRELERPLEELLNDTSGLQKIWAAWSHIWKERPAEQATSLY